MDPQQPSTSQNQNFVVAEKGKVYCIKDPNSGSIIYAIATGENNVFQQMTVEQQAEYEKTGSVIFEPSENCPAQIPDQRGIADNASRDQLKNEPETPQMTDDDPEIIDILDSDNSAEIQYTQNQPRNHVQSPQDHVQQDYGQIQNPVSNRPQIQQQQNVQYPPRLEPQQPANLMQTLRHQSNAYHQQQQARQQPQTRCPVRKSWFMVASAVEQPYINNFLVNNAVDPLPVLRPEIIDDFIERCCSTKQNVPRQYAHTQQRVYSNRLYQNPSSVNHPQGYQRSQYSRQALRTIPVIQPMQSGQKIRVVLPKKMYNRANGCGKVTRNYGNEQTIQSQN